MGDKQLSGEHVLRYDMIARALQMEVLRGIKKKPGVPDRGEGEKSYLAFRGWRRVGTRQISPS